ncbi:hypothetical protein [Kitasatospora sp. NPDC002040]|uniref:hypothetical protein n=1 Tax=Kitasatospora sp. NPDC002040 TaxID=3154661 RepID=UPI00331FE885
MSEEQQGQPAVPQAQGQAPQAVPPQQQAAPLPPIPQPPIPQQPVQGFPPVAHGGPPTTPAVRQDQYNQGGYGYPPIAPQPIPHGRYGPGTFQHDAEEPDWSAMASRHEDERRRRKRTMVLLSVLGSLVLVGGIVTAAVLLNSKDKPTDPVVVASGSASPSAKASGTPSASTTAKSKNPEEALSRGATDKAPMSVDTLFPKATLTVDGQVLNKVVTEHGDECASGTVNGLGTVLEKENCRDIYLATYLSDKAAVTVGIVLFDAKTQADRAQAKVVGNIKPLRSAQTPRFCPDLSQCAFSNKAFGRYMVFTTAGNADGTPVTEGTPATKQAAAAVAKQVLDDLKARGQAALSNAG